MCIIRVVSDSLIFLFSLVDQSDPYGFVAGQHFNSVLRRYGAPIIILNLVKVGAFDLKKSVCITNVFSNRNKT